MWADDIYHPQDKDFRLSFSSEELRTLARFDDVFREAFAGEETLTLQGFLATEAASKLRDSARGALEALNETTDR